MIHPLLQQFIDGVTHAGLYIDTPDGPAEASFKGYVRQPLLIVEINDHAIRYAPVTFECKRRAPVMPAGWCTMDARGLMVTCWPDADFTAMRRGSSITMTITLTPQLDTGD